MATLRTALKKSQKNKYIRVVQYCILQNTLRTYEFLAWKPLILLQIGVYQSLLHLMALKRHGGLYNRVPFIDRR